MSLCTWGHRPSGNWQPGGKKRRKDRIMNAQFCIRTATYAALGATLGVVLSCLLFGCDARQIATGMAAGLAGGMVAGIRDSLPIVRDCRG